MNRIRVSDCIWAASLAFGVSRKRILSRQRSQPVVDARSAAYWLACAETEQTLMAIGDGFRRNHASVVNGTRSVERRVTWDGDFEDRLQAAWLILHKPEAAHA